MNQILALADIHHPWVALVLFVLCASAWWFAMRRRDSVGGHHWHNYADDLPPWVCGLLMLLLVLIFCAAVFALGAGYAARTL